MNNKIPYLIFSREIVPKLLSTGNLGTVIAEIAKNLIVICLCKIEATPYDKEVVKSSV